MLFHEGFQIHPVLARKRIAADLLRLFAVARTQMIQRGLFFALIAAQLIVVQAEIAVEDEVRVPVRPSVFLVKGFPIGAEAFGEVLPAERVLVMELTL